MRSLHQLLGLRADVRGVGAVERRAEVGDARLDRGGGLLVERLAMLLEALLGRVDERLGLVTRLGEFPQLARLVGVRLGVVDHALDFLLGEAGPRLDADLLLVAGAEVTSPTR